MIDVKLNKSLSIVEDHDALRICLATAMQKCGFHARTASSVAFGIAGVEQGAPGYAVIDLQLPDSNNLDIVKSWEKRDPEARAIILAGYGNSPKTIAAARFGAEKYIVKPATPDEIVDVLLASKDQNPPALENPISPDDARIEHIASVFYQAGGTAPDHAQAHVAAHPET